jgi:Macrocin-O-methyltransferase (TylF)
LIVKSLPLRVIHRLNVVRRLNIVADNVACRLIPKRRAITVGAANSLCDKARLLGLQKVAEEVARRRLQGHIVECGVYRGGSAVVIAEWLPRSSKQREVWLFDVFSGMPEPGPDDPPEAWEDVDKFVSIVKGFCTRLLPRPSYLSSASTLW